MKHFGRLNWPRAFPWLLTILLLLVLAEKVVTGAQAIHFVLQVTVVPVLISLALAYLLEPLVEFFEGRGLHRWQATAATLLLSVLVLALLAVLVLPRIGAQLVVTGQKLPAAISQAAAKIKPKLDALHDLNPGVYDRVRDQVRQALEEPDALVSPAVGYVQRGLLGLVDLTASLLNLILIPFFVYYILNEGKSWQAETTQLIPPRHRATVESLGEQVNLVASNFVRGQLLVSAAMSVFYIIGFLILGVPLAFTLGIISGFGNLVPYVGGLIAAVLTVLITAVDQPQLWRIIAVIGVYVLVQSLEGFYLTPRILGQRLELHPFLVIIGVLIGGSLFGVLGIILATPIMAIARVFLRFAREAYVSSNFYHSAGGLVLATESGVSEPTAGPPPLPANHVADSNSKD